MQTLHRSPQLLYPCNPWMTQHHHARCQMPIPPRYPQQMSREHQLPHALPHAHSLGGRPTLLAQETDLHAVAASLSPTSVLPSSSTRSHQIVGPSFTHSLQPPNRCALALLRRRMALRAAICVRSSRSVTQTQNHEIISTKMKVKNTRFLSPSPPHVAAAYDGLCICAEG